MKPHERTEAQWGRVQQCLPPQKPRVGRPNHDHRRIITGLLWILKTGAPWRDLPECSGPWQTVASRFDRWRKAGLWDRLLAPLQPQADAQGQIDWQIHFVDGTTVRAHPHAAGAKKGGPPTKRWARAGGGWSPKVHRRAEGTGTPLTILLPPGQQHERTRFEPLLDQGAAKRIGRGRPKLRPRRIVGDQGYSSLQELAVQAALSGDRAFVYQAVAADPLTSSVLTLDEIRQMTDELFVASSPWLPPEWSAGP